MILWMAARSRGPDQPLFGSLFWSSAIEKELGSLSTLFVVLDYCGTLAVRLSWCAALALDETTTMRLTKEKFLRASGWSLPPYVYNNLSINPLVCRKSSELVYYERFLRDARLQDSVILDRPGLGRRYLIQKNGTKIRNRKSAIHGWRSSMT